MDTNSLIELVNLLERRALSLLSQSNRYLLVALGTNGAALSQLPPVLRLFLDLNNSPYYEYTQISIALGILLLGFVNLFLGWRILRVVEHHRLVQTRLMLAEGLVLTVIHNNADVQSNKNTHDNYSTNLLPIDKFAKLITGKCLQEFWDSFDEELCTAVQKLQSTGLSLPLLWCSGHSSRAILGKVIVVWGILIKITAIIWIVKFVL